MTEQTKQTSQHPSRLKHYTWMKPGGSGVLDGFFGVTFKGLPKLMRGRYRIKVTGLKNPQICANIKKEGEGKFR